MSNMAEEPVVRLRTVGLALTLQCNFACAHCIVEAGPSLSASISAVEAEGLIEAIAEESESICFTGGESFLKKDVLLRCIEVARARGLSATLVTNAYWATDSSRTLRYLKELSSAGLTGICISLDRFHLPFVTEENALRVARLSAEVGLQHIIRICATKEDDFAATFRKRHSSSGVRFQQICVVRLGRAKCLPLTWFDSTPDPPAGRCSTILAPIVLPDGLVQACCGPGTDFRNGNPFNLGNWRKESLRVLLRNHRTSVFVMAVNNFGPSELVNLVRRSRPVETPKRACYTGMCEVCIDIMNNPEAVAALQETFEDPDTLTKLIAGQVYQQSCSYLRHVLKVNCI